MSERKMPVRTKVVFLKGDDWAGWEFTAQTNIKLGVYEDLVSGEPLKIRPALAKIVKAWNFVDEDGKPLGDPNLETMREIPLDLVTVMLEGYNEQQAEVPPN